MPISVATAIEVPVHLTVESQFAYGVMNYQVKYQNVTVMKVEHTRKNWMEETAVELVNLIQFRNSRLGLSKPSNNDEKDIEDVDNSNESASRLGM